jgi:hypothetical protein
MMPPAHGRWLADAMTNCLARVPPDDGHLTMLLNRPAEILADLESRFESHAPSLPAELSKQVEMVETAE